MLFIALQSDAHWNVWKLSSSKNESIYSLFILVQSLKNNNIFYFILFEIVDKAANKVPYSFQDIIWNYS